MFTKLSLHFKNETAITSVHCKMRTSRVVGIAGDCQVSVNPAQREDLHRPHRMQVKHWRL